VATLAQTAKVLDSLKTYKRKYIKKQFSDLDESATRIMINAFLTDVLGYVELDEIKTEYNIRGEYADYVIQLKRKKQFVVEVKSVQLDLNERHLRQSLSYAANEGIDWIILTNGRTFQFYRVLFEKPIRTELLVSVDFVDAYPTDMKKYAEILVLFTKRGVEKNEHELFWQRSIALSPHNISKLLYSEEVVRLARRELKKSSGIYFEPEAIKDALRICLSKAVDTESLRYRGLK
jgi:predicted type IV restriction endonuclease